MSRKAAENEVRRQYILDAARRLYEQKGIEETSMDDIAAAADYTRRTLYAYFKSRDDISLSILVKDLRNRWGEQREAITSADTGLDKMRAWAESLYTFTRRNPHSITLQLYWDFRGIERDSIGRDTFDAFEAVNNELAEGLREIFRLGIRDKSMRSDVKIDLTISQFLYSFRAILNRALSPSYSFASFDADEYVDHFLAGFIGSIRSEGDVHATTR